MTRRRRKPAETEPSLPPLTEEDLHTGDSVCEAPEGSSPFYPWQERAVEALEGRSAILSAPTGSGKTWVAYRSKGYWGYNPETLDQWAGPLTITEEYLEANPTFVAYAADDEDRILGF